MPKTIYIIGIGGRTGALFARELQKTSDIVGVGRPSEVEMIARGALEVQRGPAAPEVLRVEAISEQDLNLAINRKYPDFIWLAVRNPVTEAVKNYYRYFAGKENVPSLILSQNGLSAIEDAKTALREVLGEAAEKVKIIRVSMINGVDAKMEKAAIASDGATASSGDIFRVIYKLPVKLGFGRFGTTGKTREQSGLAEIFLAAGFKAREFYGKEVSQMENSKLFTNLIGMASAVNGMAADAGLRDKEIFKNEVAMLREYVLAVRAAGGGFTGDFCGYPIGFLAQLMLLPVWVLLPFRGLLARIVAKGRNRPKDLGEIDYYNGEVVRLGRRFNIETSMNNQIVARAKELAAKSLVKG